MTIALMRDGYVTAYNKVKAGNIIARGKKKDHVTENCCLH